MNWILPTAVKINGMEHGINTDYRDILDIIEHLQDEKERMQTRAYIAMSLFYVDFKSVPSEEWESAAKQMMDFINGGEKDDEAMPSPKRIDWVQDEGIIAADVNRVMGCEIRSLPFLHWWSFLAGFRAVGEGQLSAVVAIREKRRKGQKLEKWEREFYAENKSRIDFKNKYTTEEQAERERLQALLRE